MDNLRWVLLFIGIVIILLVYLFSRFNLFERLGKRLSGSASDRTGASLSDRREPVSFDGEIEVLDEADDVAFHVSEFSAEIPSVHHDPDEDPRQAIAADDWRDTVSVSRSSLVEDEVQQTAIEHDTVPGVDRQAAASRAADNDEPPTLQPTPSAQTSRTPRPEPVTTASESSSRQQEPRQDTLPLGMQPLVLVLSVMADDENWFAGASLVRALEQEGLQFGDMDIFHYFHQQQGPALFSVANVLEPGTFDLSALGTLTTPGISLFCQLPGVLAPDQAFDIMLERARNIADRLRGRVCDERRNALTSQRVTHYRDRIAAFNRELLLAKRA